MGYKKELLKKIRYLENPIDGYRILELEDLIAFVDSLPSETEIAKVKAKEWINSIDKPYPWTHAVVDVMDIYFNWLDKEKS